MSQIANDTIIVNDVGPRDGLQNQRKILEPEQRLQLIQALLDAGMKHIEVGAFVSPKAVPAMAGADRILAGLPQRDDVQFTTLVPNLKGFELARAAGARSVSMVLYASEGMAQKNARMSRAEAEEDTLRIMTLARPAGIRLTATVSVAFECPFDGRVDPAVVEGMTRRMLEQGVDEVCIADTIGAANPGQVKSLADALVRQHGNEQLSFHFHDTRALGLANVYAAVAAGIRKFDSSIGGLGGCPFAPGASGNVATEDVVMLLGQMGFDTGIDLPKLLQASALARELTGTAPGGRALPWLQRYVQKQQQGQPLRAAG
jgi:hydroxymethylglutaryl-CoA lyase